MTFPFALKPKKIIIFMMALLVVIIASYLVGNYLTNPKWVVDDYFQALKAKDYNKAYGYFTSDKSPTLNKEAFVAWQRNNDQTSGPLKYTALGKAEVGTNSARVNYLLQREKEVDKEENFFALTRSGNTMFFWPKWKIKIPSRSQKFLLHFEGAKLYLDGRATGLTTKRAQPFVIKVFNGEHKMEFKAKNAKVLLVDLKRAVPKMEPTKAVINDISATARDLAGRIKEAYNTNDKALLSTLLGTGSDEISEQQKYYTAFTDLKDISVNVNDFYSPDKIDVDIYLTFDGERTNPYYDYWGCLTMRYVVFINQNGKWEINSINNKSTPQQKGSVDNKNI